MKQLKAYPSKEYGFTYDTAEVEELIAKRYATIAEMRELLRPVAEHNCSNYSVWMQSYVKDIRGWLNANP